MDANFPEMVLAVCALIRGAAERVRHESLEVRPVRDTCARARGDLLYVPIFSYLNGELLSAAVTRGVQDQRVEAYLDSFVRFASPYLETRTRRATRIVRRLQDHRGRGSGILSHPEGFIDP